MDHFVVLGGIAASGGALALDFVGDVKGFRIEPSLGVGGRIETGPLNAMLFGQFKMNLSRTTFTQESLQTTQSFKAIPGMQVGVMLGWMLGASWSLDLGSALTWYWKRYGYKDELQNVEIFTSPWLEISTYLGLGYHF